MNQVRVAALFAATALLLSLSTFASPVRAEDWKLFYKDADETKEYYFDKASIVRPEPKTVRVWEKVVEVDTRKDTKTDLWKAQVEINCAKRQYVVLTDKPEEPGLQKAKDTKFLSEKKISTDPALEGNVLWALQENVCP